MPEVTLHQRQVARLVIEPHPGRLPKCVHALELDHGCPAGPSIYLQTAIRKLASEMQPVRFCSEGVSSASNK